MPGPWLEPPQLPTSAVPCRKESNERSSLPLLIHSPTHPGVQPPPRERARNAQRHHIHRHQIHRDKGREAGRETERLGEMSKETNGQSGNRQNGQRRWPERAWRGCSERQGGQSLRVPGAGGRRDTEAVLRPPPARCPGRSTSLISHLAAPGPVCAEPGIPPAAQTAPALILATPSFPGARPPPRGLEDPPWNRGPSLARESTAGHDWRGSPELRARREGPGDCRWGFQAWAARCSHR